MERESHVDHVGDVVVITHSGYIDEANPFTSATFSNVGDFGDDFGFDDMTIGSVQQVVRVPEPPMLALLALALLGLAFFRRASGNLRPLRGAKGQLALTFR